MWLTLTKAKPMKKPFEKSKADKERKGAKEGSKKELKLDAKQAKTIAAGKGKK